jgi:ribosomal protein L29
MRTPDRNTAVFSTSAIDLFASALGAFILLVMLLFPYYRNAGSADAFSKTEEIMELRRLASGEIEDLLANQRMAQNELEQLNEVNLGVEAQISWLRKQMADIKTQLAEDPVIEPEPVEEITEPDPRALVAGVEFSILGLASESKTFVIVIDMSGSMLKYTDLMIESVLEVLEPLDDSNRFAILGYQGNPAPVIWNFPESGQLIQATPENLQDAAGFTRSLARRFAGSTPTHFAVLSALQYPADAIILMSDGEPDNAPGFIIQDITKLNRFENKEIHTVAIGDYTQNRGLVMFLQALAKQNGGDFVGVSR